MGISLGLLVPVHQLVDRPHIITTVDADGRERNDVHTIAHGGDGNAVDVDDCCIVDMVGTMALLLHADVGGGERHELVH